MPLNIEKQKLKLNKNVIRDTNTAWIEQDIVVPDTKPDVVKIIKVDANAYVTNSEIIDESIRVSMQISYYIIYLSETGEIRSINVTYPYTKIIEDKNANSNMAIRIRPTVRNIIYSLPNERKISVKVEILFRYKMTEVGDIEMLKQIEQCDSLECKMGRDTFFNILEKKQEIIDVREDIMLPDSMPGMKEILRVSSDITNTEYKVSYNKILVKGEIKTDIVYIDNTDEKEVYTYNTNIPFTGMIEFSNISDYSQFDIDYSLKSFDISVDNADERGNMIAINAEVMADAVMYEEREVDYIDDFYSMDAELGYNKEGVSIVKNSERIEKNISLKENVGVVEENSRILDYEFDVSNLVTKISGGNVYVSGSVKVSVMYRTDESKKIENKVYDLLLDTTVPLSRDIDEKFVNVNITVTREMVRINGINVEAQVDLLITVIVDNVENISEIENITENNIDDNQFDSMNIYIVKKGDTLWNIAKKYKTSVAKIINTNNIEDENKIDIGQKILIIR